MKTRFNTYDIVCAVTELQKLVGLRVNQIYDVDHKTYLIRLHGGESKTMLLVESGIRFHTTVFEWPKNVAPSGFSMKLRKHLKNKRLEKLEQLGLDRIVDFQFGTGEAAYHVIVELYDRGNIILTDHEYTIVYILRPHFENDDVKLTVRERYPVNRAKSASSVPNEEALRQAIASASPGDNLKRVLMPIVDGGPAVIDHVLTKYKLDNYIVKKYDEELNDEKTDGTAQKGKKKTNQRKKFITDCNGPLFDVDKDLEQLIEAIKEADKLVIEARTSTSKGYIFQKKEKKPSADGESDEYIVQNIEFHPYLFAQLASLPAVEFESFMLAADDFYSNLEGQKIDMQVLQQERDAFKKLSNVKKDHAKRLEDLSKTQEEDREKAELISINQALVDKAILAIRSALAVQMSWPDVNELVKAAQERDDPAAKIIHQLKLHMNHITLKLYPEHLDDSDEDNSDSEKTKNKYYLIDVDLSLSAWANACKYYDQKRYAAQKEQKTIDASQKALKSAEKKTQQTLKDVRTISTIAKARKVYWFEKFYWFVSSENYLVIGGRDAQQNELIVKRYMRPTDIYVHAEIQGASSVVIRNPTAGDVPIKTLIEAGTMAICYSVAWDAKVVTNAYWVHSAQVSKTAPTGEYLGTGSFMIRGKKNFLPSCHLIMGMSLLFKLEESFVEKHKGERRVRTFGDDEPENNLPDIKEENESTEISVKPQLTVEERVDKTVDNNTKPTGVDAVNASSSGETDEEDVTNFPDIHVKVEHDTGKITVRTEAELEEKSENLVIKKDQQQDEITIIPAAQPRKKQQTTKTKRKEEKQRKAEKHLQQQILNAENNQNKDAGQKKRGQKGKMKKMKAKYRDQDEEEREMRMQILKSSGKDKPGADDPTEISKSLIDAKSEFKKNWEKREYQKQEENDDGEEIPIDGDEELLDSLTGQPFDDDELLFAIPIVAPYQALQNYKYRVKLTPGTGKRGKAAKTALAMFAKDKNCGIREKDLLKGIKDETVARNIPGKTKLSAPQLQKFKS